jgi:hypothetical protein
MRQAHATGADRTLTGASPDVASDVRDNSAGRSSKTPASLSKRQAI